MVVNLVIGLIGMTFILVAFFLNEFYKTWSQNTIRYNITNILGSGLLIYYAFAIDSIPFIILNGVWFITAVIKLVKIS